MVIQTDIAVSTSRQLSSGVQGGLHTRRPITACSSASYVAEKEGTYQRLKRIYVRWNIHEDVMAVDISRYTRMSPTMSLCVPVVERRIGGSAYYWTFYRISIWEDHLQCKFLALPVSLL